MSKPNVKVTIHLWTAYLPSGADCWDHGQASVQVGQNRAHNIKGGNAVLFNHPANMPAAVLEALQRAGLVCAAPPRKVR